MDQPEEKTQEAVRPTESADSSARKARITPRQLWAVRKQYMTKQEPRRLAAVPAADAQKEAHEKAKSSLETTVLRIRAAKEALASGQTQAQPAPASAPLPELADPTAVVETKPELKAAAEEVKPVAEVKATAEATPAAEVKAVEIKPPAEAKAVPEMKAVAAAKPATPVKVAALARPKAGVKDISDELINELLDEPTQKREPKMVPVSRQPGAMRYPYATHAPAPDDKKDDATEPVLRKADRKVSAAFVLGALVVFVMLVTGLFIARQQGRIRTLEQRVAEIETAVMSPHYVQSDAPVQSARR